jgi:membrane protein
LAIFPGALALLGLLPLLRLQHSLPTLQALTRRGLPQNVAELILAEVGRLDSRHVWGLVFTVVPALYYGGLALGSLLTGVRQAFGKKDQPLRDTLHGATLTGLVLAAAPVLLLLLMIAGWLLSWLAAHGVLGAGLDSLVSALRWPLLSFGFQQLTRGLYRFAAGNPHNHGLFSPGSLFAAVGWGLCTAGFETFVLAFSNLGATYGSLAAVIALMFYVNLLATVVLLGAEIDASRA